MPESSTTVKYSPLDCPAPAIRSSLIASNIASNIASKMPGTWRAIAVFAYMSWIPGLGLITPIFIWFLYRHRFLRIHAFNAGLIHLIGLIFIAPMYTANILFIYESKQSFASYMDIVGILLTQEPIVAQILLWFFGIAFLIWTMIIKHTALRHRRGEIAQKLIFTYALPAILIALVLLYNNIFWYVPNSTSREFLSWNRFRDPLLLLPGFSITTICVFFSMIALRSEHLRLWPGLYLRILRSEKLRGRKRRLAAAFRSAFLPGWGHIYQGRFAAGLASIASFLLLLLFFVLSALFLYGEAIKDASGLNANAAWKLLNDLGMRSHIPDRVFQNLFRNYYTLAFLGTLLIVFYIYGIINSVRPARAHEPYAGLRQYAPFSVLAHLVPISILLLIPLTFISAPPKKNSPAPMPYVPEFFKMPEKKMSLKGAAMSGDQSKTYGRRSGKTGGGARVRGAGEITFGSALKSGKTGRDKSKMLIDERRGKDPSGGIPGKRAQMTYSNYLSARIRSLERVLNYWKTMPDAYHAVFRYRITDAGRMREVEIIDPSIHPDYDQKTLELIRSMDPILPPPHGRDAQITELFWNTYKGDMSLPSQLKRQLSRAFDGRIITPL